ncbi:hypothetical protein GR925_01025 [Streptomyces sp. HUCO-GS316]|uniref:excalibur calcium-binding domain-containing protein n=1 Tax=Streptomyces sp. HUCO-GS316 TaxID=2692198 RepID=UPI00136B20C9|nr:excalibur calcium-binding domain-containing protein [Streptomyces sp. HUCO-GS316]MXM62068.1 hypothetical protein [Streptomyces sp. HUCO-GS316]
MTNPYTTPPMPPSVSGPAPKWARKRYVLPALAPAFMTGIGAGASGQDTETTDEKPAAAEPRPTVTVTATATATAPAEEPEPAPTVTVTKRVKVTRTVTAEPAAGSGSDDTGSADVYYANCSEARAAGAAPILRGEPGYDSHLDRDNDGVACDA